MKDRCDFCYRLAVSVIVGPWRAWRAALGVARRRARCCGRCVEQAIAYVQ